MICASMTKVELEVPDSALRFLRAMQVLWQHPEEWVHQYLTNAIIKSIESDIDEGMLVDKDRLKELYGIDRLGMQELPLNREVLTA